MRAIGIIPARYESSRFPGKPLALILGKTMISRVYQQATLSRFLQSVWVATDDKRIYSHCKNENIPVLMTSKLHKSGTDRVAEACGKIEGDVILNIQGDEPFIPPSYFDKIIQAFNHTNAGICSLLTRLEDPENLMNPHVVKVVLKDSGDAMYFSRAAIPYIRHQGIKTEFWRHIGVYAFRRHTLTKIKELPAGLCEQLEGLEQLRWLAAGFDIHMVKVPKSTIGIDLPEDIEKAEKWIKSRKK